MLPVGNYQVLFVTKNCLGFIEGDLVLLPVCICLCRIPLKFKIFEFILISAFPFRVHFHTTCRISPS